MTNREIGVQTGDRRWHRETEVNIGTSQCNPLLCLEIKYTNILFLLNRTLNKWHNLTDTVNRGFMASVLLEYLQLVIHWPAKDCCQTGTWTECGYNPPVGRQRAKQLDECPGYKLHPCTETVHSSPCLLAMQSSAIAAGASPPHSATTEEHRCLQGLQWANAMTATSMCAMLQQSRSGG